MTRLLSVRLATTAFCFFAGASLASAQVQLNIQPGTQLSWPTPNTTNTYHLQWSPSSGGTWSDLVAAVTGDGTTHTNFDSVAIGSHQYQDLEIIPGTAPTTASPANGGFETGSGSSATSWTVDTAGGGPRTRFVQMTIPTAARLISRSIWPALGRVRWFSLTNREYR